MRTKPKRNGCNRDNHFSEFQGLKKKKQFLDCITLQQNFGITNLSSGNTNLIIGKRTQCKDSEKDPIKKVV